MVCLNHKERGSRARWRAKIVTAQHMRQFLKGDQQRERQLDARSEPLPRSEPVGSRAFLWVYAIPAEQDVLCAKMRSVIRFNSAAWFIPMLGMPKAQAERPCQAFSVLKGVALAHMQI